MSPLFSGCFFVVISLFPISQEVQKVPNVVCTVITNLRARKELGRAQKELDRAEQKSNEVEKESAGVGPVWSDKKNTLLQTLEKRISRVDFILSTLSGVSTLASRCKEPVGQSAAQDSQIVDMANKDIERRSLGAGKVVE